MWGLLSLVKTNKDPPSHDCIEILVVEDNNINQKVICATLKKLGYDNIAVVENGKKAVDMTLETHFDLVLMDVQMPVMGGIEATEIIRKREQKSQRTCIVGLSANAFPADIRLGLESGMNDYLIKPIQKEKRNNILDAILVARKSG